MKAITVTLPMNVQTLILQAKKRAVSGIEGLTEVLVGSLVSIVVAVVLFAGLYPTVTTQITKYLTNASSTSYVGSGLAPLVSLIPTLIVIFFSIGAFFLTFELMRMGRGHNPL
jgi:uncharacterized membrane protein required for colicin V production